MFLQHFSFHSTVFSKIQTPKKSWDGIQFTLARLCHIRMPCLLTSRGVQSLVVLHEAFISREDWYSHTQPTCRQWQSGAAPTEKKPPTKNNVNWNRTFAWGSLSAQVNQGKYFFGLFVWGVKQKKTKKKKLKNRGGVWTRAGRAQTGHCILIRLLQGFRAWTKSGGTLDHDPATDICQNPSRRKR